MLMTVNFASDNMDAAAYPAYIVLAILMTEDQLICAVNCLNAQRSVSWQAAKSPRGAWL
jgi:hypothetical protein